MKKALMMVVCFSFAGVGPANAQEATEEQGQAVAQASATPEPVQPTGVAPKQAPPAPPPQPPPPPTEAAGQAQAQVPAPASPVEDGQWVYTSQYGWVFMPYGDQYVAQGIGTDGNPYSYIYHPGYGWQWLASPWLLGLGPNPYFGALGPAYFGWYRSLQAARHDWGGRRGAWSYLGGG